MKILSAAYLRAIIRTNSDVDKVTKLLNPYDGKNLTEAEKKKVITISTDFFKRTLKYFDEVNSAFKKVKRKTTCIMCSIQNMHSQLIRPATKKRLNLLLAIWMMKNSIQLIAIIYTAYI